MKSNQDQRAFTSCDKIYIYRERERVEGSYRHWFLFDLSYQTTKKLDCGLKKSSLCFSDRP